MSLPELLIIAYGLFGIAVVLSRGLRDRVIFNFREIVHVWSRSIEAVLEAGARLSEKPTRPAASGQVDPYTTSPLSVEWLVAQFMADRLTWIEFELRMDALFARWSEQNAEDEEWDPFGPVKLRGQWKWDGNALRAPTVGEGAKGMFQVPSHYVGSTSSKPQIYAWPPSWFNPEMRWLPLSVRDVDVARKVLRRVDPRAKLLKVHRDEKGRVVLLIELDGETAYYRPHAGQVPLAGQTRVASKPLVQ